LSNQDFLSETGVEALYRQARQGLVEPGAAECLAAVAAVMWRRDASGELSVYLGRRANTLRFVPGRWSFPGGGLSAGDRQVAIAGAGGDEAARLAALIREVAEETGVELPARADRYAEAGCFITPEFSPIRFDAWHYLVEVDQDAAPDYRVSEGEFVDGAWVRPGQALENWRQGRWLISRPTRRILDALVAGPEGAAARCRDAAERENQGPRTFAIVPGVFMTPVRTPTLPPATHTNCYLVGSRDLVVVDPASPYADEQAVLDRDIDDLLARGHRVVEIWLTHHHGDHVGGAAHLARRLGVPVAAHPRTAELLAARVEPVKIDRLLHDGDTLELAGDPPRRVRAVFTPGHAPGHVCVLEEHTGFLIAGDMVAGVGTIVIEPSEGHMGDYLRSLERMKALAAAALLPAHGPIVIDVAGKLDQYIGHRLWREQRVVDALRQLGPATPRELVAVAYADVPAAIHRLAELSLIAHLIKLAEDGAAAREPAGEPAGQGDRQGDRWRYLSSTP
jgi:endoribonuclease LACTB2